MSIFASAVHRRGFDAEAARERMAAILREIAPEPVRGTARCDAEVVGSHVQGRLNLPDHSLRRGLSLCQGKLFDVGASWWEPGSGVPDGSFAIVRDGPDAFEAVTDPAGSRMLWYYHDDDLFLVSNSERAVTMYAGRFELNRDVVPWVVSTGTRGLGGSYNRLLRQLPPAAVAQLDRATWDLGVTAEEIRFREVPRSREEHLAALDAALSATFAAFGPSDAAHGIIALSGGTDSRALAAYLSRDAAAGWRSYSVGSPQAIAMPASDASVAARVAAAVGLNHQTIVSETATEPLRLLLRRFVLGGEGRHDHMNRLDGGTTQRVLGAEGITSMIRGDEGFGWKPVAPTPLAVRQSMELLLCGDIANLRPHLTAFGLEGHAFPEELRQSPDETLEAWRDRLYHRFRLPVVLAALTEHKSAYFDVINPLLSRRALEVTRSLPDALRTDKALFREVVRQVGPDIDFAGRDGAPIRLENMRHAEVVRAMREALASETAERVFGAPLARWARAEIHPVRHFCNRVVQAVGKRRRRLGGRPPSTTAIHLEPLRLAFRMYIAVTMIDQLEADARFRSSAAPRAAAA
jgi:hypothetical protein